MRYGMLALLVVLFFVAGCGRNDKKKSSADENGASDDLEKTFEARLKKAVADERRRLEEKQLDERLEKKKEELRKAEHLLQQRQLIQKGQEALRNGFPGAPLAPHPTDQLNERVKYAKILRMERERDAAIANEFGDERVDLENSTKELRVWARTERLRLERNPKLKEEFKKFLKDLNRQEAELDAKKANLNFRAETRRVELDREIQKVRSASAALIAEQEKGKGAKPFVP